MKDCTDSRLEKLLHHYELGLLSEEDHLAVELHLYECEHCFARVEKFERAARLIRHDSAVRTSVNRLAGDLDAGRVTVAEEDDRAGGHKTWWTFLPPILAAAAVLLILLVTDWQIEIRPTQEAVAVENRLAVMYFQNLANEQDTLRLGEITANLLITDLSESHYIQVVSSQRIYDILKLLGHEDSWVIDQGMAKQIAEKAGARWMLLGSILQVEPRMELTSQLVDVSTGSAVAAQRVTGEPGEDIFSLVDKLTIGIKNDLTLPPDARLETDRRVADVTTHSERAYRYYLDGVDFFWKFYFDEARQSFRQALTYDSTFAMAYYYMSRLVRLDFINQAVEYSAGASQREGYLIRSRAALIAGDVDEAMRELRGALERYPDEKEALYLLGSLYRQRSEYDSAIVYLTQAVEIDPLYKPAYNLLAYTYNAIGDFDRAIQAIDKNIDLAPGEANPYDTRGEICARNGKLDEAIASYRKALEIRPDFPNSLMYLSYMLLFKGEYTEADQYMHKFITISTGVSRVAGRVYLAYIPLYQGKFEEAIRILNDGIAADRLENAEPDEVAWKYLLKARILAEKNNLPQAVQEYEKYLAFRKADSTLPPPPHIEHYIQLLAQNNEFARAGEVAEHFKQKLEETGQPLTFYWYALGCVELEKENYSEAIKHFKQALSDCDGFPQLFMLGVAYFEAGRYAEAIEQFEKSSKSYNSPRAYWSTWSVKTHYYLGLIYEELGQPKQAITQYRQFIEIWKNADPGIASLEDAKSRLARLGEVS